MDITSGLIAIGAGLAVGLTGIGTGNGQGQVVAAALQGMARNPEMESKLRTNMFIGAGLCETSVIYGLVIAIVLISKM